MYLIGQGTNQIAQLCNYSTHMDFWINWVNKIPNYFHFESKTIKLDYVLVN